MLLCGGPQGLPRVEPVHQVVEVVSGESPLKGLGDGLIVLLEGQQAVLNVGERAEIVRRQDVALHDREVDLDLVQPAGNNVFWNNIPHIYDGADASRIKVRGSICRD